MSKLNVAVIFGGYSSEHQVSVNSAVNIINNMSFEKYNIIPVYITTKGSWLLYDGNLDGLKNVQWEKFGTPCQLSLDRNDKGLLRISGGKVKKLPVDVVFPALHGKNGEDGTIQGIFEIAGIPYVGCGVLASAIAMDKAYTKIIVDTLGIQQAKHLLFTADELADMDEALKLVRYKLGYPCFVKPCRSGSSVGVSKATNKNELKAAFELALEQDARILVEKAIIGRELECAVLGNGSLDTKVTNVGEVLAAAEFYDFDAKYNNADSKTVVPAELDEDMAEEIRKSALKIFKAIDGCGLSRVDFFLEEATGKVIFNEINTLPGFTDISMYPILVNQMGIAPHKLMDILIDIALDK